MAMGGSWGGLPFIGTYHEGGIAPVEGYAHVAKGEEVTPAGQRSRANGPLVHMENVVFKSEEDSELFARKLGWQLK